MRTEAGDTQLQKRIVSELRTEDALSVSDLAETLDCSESYIYKIRDEYEGVIEGLSSTYNVMQSLGESHGIFLAEDLMREFGVEDGQWVRVRWENSDATPAVGKVRKSEEFELENDFHSYLYTLDSISENIPSQELDKFSTLNEHGIELSDPRDLGTLFEELQDNLIPESAQAVVGASLLSIPHSPEHEESLVSTPHGQFGTELLQEIFFGSPPKIQDIVPIQSEIETPEKVYFVTLFRKISEEKKEIAKENVLDTRHFLRDGQHFVPGVENLVGPVTVDAESEIIEVTEDNLEIVSGSIRHLSSTDYHIEFEEIETIVDSAIDEISYGDVEAPSYRSNSEREFLAFTFTQIGVLLAVQPGRLTWYYPPDIGPIDWFVNRLSEIIVEEINAEFTSEERPLYETVEDTGPYVWDTNAIYFQDEDDEPMSIADALLANTDFYDSEFHIPWITLYEINKHKDSDNVAPRVCEQGLDNLDILHQLDGINFLDLEVEQIPDSIPSDIDSSSVADMVALNATQAQEGVLVTSDNRLQDISSISDVPILSTSQSRLVETSAC